MARQQSNTSTISNRIPPHTMDVERSVLGSILIDVNALDSAMENLSETSFYAPAHQKIFTCIRTLYSHEAGIDIITLAEELRKNQWLEAVGGEAYLSELVDTVATAANITSHVKILNEKSTLRSLITAASEITTDCFQPDVETSKIVDRAEAKIFAIAEGTIKNKPERMRELLPVTFVDIERYAREGGVSGIQSGFTKLDEMTTGFHPGDLVIIAARPGMGKTSLALSIALNTAVHNKKRTPTILFSLEMSKQQLVQRMLCAEAQIDIHRLRGGKLSKKELSNLSLAAGPLYEAPIFIDDTPGISVMEIRAKCRRLKAKEDLGMIMIDYLQLMGIVERSENRQQEISQISRSLKEIAKELGVPILTLSQLNRAVEQRSTGHRPQLSDLRESGAIEQDADLVLFVFREFKYKPEDENLKKVAEIIIGKQRNGPVGTVLLSFIDEFASFQNLDMVRTGPEKETF
ncbi:MAG: replicative DNA helicase [Chitinivibrionales bacterium]|nr:replicative DNA helicase [Chitinivibrionales bacterium]